VKPKTGKHSTYGIPGHDMGSVGGIHRIEKLIRPFSQHIQFDWRKDIRTRLPADPGGKAPQVLAAIRRLPLKARKLRCEKYQVLAGSRPDLQNPAT
jgi:hypothetical protein